MRTLSAVAVLLCSLSLFAANVQLQPARLDGAAAAGYFWAADFNGDGLDDLLDFNQLQFNLGGRLAPAITVQQIKKGAASIRAAGNFNSDAFADLIMGYEYGQNFGRNSVLLGNGTGGFTELPVSGEDGLVEDVVDFTGDGVTDLIQWKPGQLTLKRGVGDGTFVLHQKFAGWEPWESLPVRTPPASADFNGDGRFDFVMRGKTGLWLFLAQPDGQFALRERYTRFMVGHLRTGDVNGDGHADIAFATSYFESPAVNVLFGDGTGHFPRYARTILTASYGDDGYGIHNIALGDFVAGGAQEVAYARMDGWVVVLSGATGGQLQEVARVRVPLWSTEILSPRFRNAASRDILVRGWASCPEAPGCHGSMRNTSDRTAWVVATEGAIDAPHRGGRARAINRTLDAGGTYTVTLDSKCPIAGLTEWTFQRDGIFVDFATSPSIVSARATYLEDAIYAELEVKDGSATRVLTGTLTPTQSGLTGKLFEWKDSPCGSWETHRVAATKK